MSWMERMILGGMILRAPEGDGGGGGGGGSGGGSGGGEGDKGKGGEGDKVAALEAANKALEERLAKLEGKKKDPPADDPDLIEKAKREAAIKAKGAEDTKRLEAAIKFNLGAKDWVKSNASLLPKDVDGIFVEAEKEKYDSAVEKDSAIKSALVQSFFSQQANMDLLTPSQKSAIEEFLKLTKNGKQEKAQQVYDSIFEPTFEMLKRLEKAKQLRMDGHANSTDADQAYKDKMMKLSRKHYTGEKENAGRN